MKERIPYLLKMPVPERANILRPRDVVLEFKGASCTIDIGAICFTRRKTSNSKRCNHTHDIESYDPRREKAIRKLIKSASDEITAKTKRPVSAAAQLKAFKQFMNWVDEERFDCGLDCKIILRSIFERFLVRTKNQVATGTLGRNTAAIRQGLILRSLRVCLDDAHWGEDFLLTKSSAKSVRHTEVPQEFKMGISLGVCREVFRTVTGNLLSAAQFPWEIALPSGPNDGQTSVLVMANGSSNLTEHFSWSRVTGMPYSVDELTEKYVEKNGPGSKQRKLAWATYYHNLRMVKEANSWKSRSRFNLGVLAAHCFSYLFLSALGSNATQFLNLEYEPNILSDFAQGEVTRQGYRRIKGRAGGKEVFYEVPLGFMPDFRMYLKLREYLVGEENVKTLLVGQVGSSLRVHEVQSYFVVSLFSRLATFGLNPPKLNPSELRVAKQHYGMTVSKPEEAAKLMGHSVGVALRDYSNGTLDEQQAQVGKFFDVIHRVAVLERGQEKPSHVESAVGKCSELDVPESIAEDLPIQPDCDSPTGCLFCAKYVLHADAADLKKLLSCRVCLQLESSNGETIKNGRETYELYFTRLNWLISEIRGHIGEVEFSRVEQDVEVGENLDVFWARKVELMVNLDFV